MERTEFCQMAHEDKEHLINKMMKCEQYKSDYPGMPVPVEYEVSTDDMLLYLVNRAICKEEMHEAKKHDYAKSDYPYEKLTDEEAKIWVKDMGEHWKKEQTDSVYDSNKSDLMGIDKTLFYVMLNYYWNKLHEKAIAMGKDTADYYVGEVKEFLTTYKKFHNRMI